MSRLLSLFRKYKLQILYLVSLLFILILSFWLFTKADVRNFLADMEAKTFDIRQLAIADSKKTNKDIVIVAIDDTSYEYIVEHYGDWPLPREVYADFINYVEAEKPTAIAFDLLFVHSLKSRPFSDAKLVSAMSENKNVFTAMNFDDQPFELRRPVNLPNYLKAALDVQSKDFNPSLYPNCRSILKDIVDSTQNIGHINTPKSRDAINRTVPLFVSYPNYNSDLSYSKEDYYPYLTLKVAQKYLQEKEHANTDKLVVDKSNNLIFANRKLPLSNKGEVFLNWYGESGSIRNKTFTYIPFWKVLRSIEAKKLGQKDQLNKDLFKGKVVYLGTSVVALSDIKTVPTEKYMPGVELHATLLNNIIDNCLIKKVNTSSNILITAIFALIVAGMVFFINSTVMSVISVALLVIGYLIFSTYVMQFFNLWIWVVMPVLSSIFVFITVYLIKYIIKSRDFEYTYKLATTDGLTELYNHRFFQEQMLFNIDYANRSQENFSLVLIDIDFFKKFNDSYGHQAGDAVLKQVAQTLKKTVRSTDLVCRYGGEEMSIILRKTNKEEAYITAQKICDAVAQKPYRLSADLEKHVTISLGVATYPMDGETPQALIEHSDKGLYAAKENGRNQVGRI